MSLYIDNDTTPSGSVYEFDIKAKTSSGSVNARTFQFSIGVDPAWLSGGTPSVALLSNCFTGVSGLPGAITWDPQGIIKITSNTSVTCASPTVINTTPKTIYRIRITNSTAFGCASPNVFFSFGDFGTLRWKTLITTYSATCTSISATSTTLFNGGAYVSTPTGKSGPSELANNNRPIISSQPSNVSVCEGQTASFSIGAIAPSFPSGNTLSYQWLLNGQAIPNATSSSFQLTSTTSTMNGGAYSVEVKSACATSYPVISDNSALTTYALNVLSSTSGSCTGGSNGSIDLTVTNGLTPYSFIWSNGATTEDISALPAGSYTVTVTDASGCSSSSTIVVAQIEAPTAAASSGSIACNGGSTSVTVSASGGTTPYNGTGAFNVTAGAYSYTVTDANGCTALASGSVSEPSLLSAAASSGSIACNGGSTSVTVSASGGTTPYTGTGSFNVTAGAYSYTVTDANGCTALANTLISQPSPIIISTFNPTVANQGEPFTLYGNGLSNVTSLLFNNIPATNLIIFGDTVITTSVPATAIDGPITVLNQNGCSATSSQNFDYLDYYGNVDLKLFIEGYFDNGNMVAAMTNRGIGTNTLAVDSTFLFLADSSDPSIIIDSAKAILDISGSASFQYRGVHVGRSYYLIIRTMNTIETWSAQPVLLSTQTIYDFTDAANKAYGDNMTEIAPGVWAIYSGELNADGFIDSFDAVFLEADNIAFAAGYLPTDLNGDGFVDTFDSPFLEQNNLNFVSSLRP
ncbi:MAG: hypothetical protein ACKOKF_09560 [Bacteroidota bacterium]